MKENYIITSEHQSLMNIKAFVDAWRNGKITITNTGDSDYANHIYDVSVIMGAISNHTYTGLGLPIPIPKESMKEGDENYAFFKSISAFRHRRILE